MLRFLVSFYLLFISFKFIFLSFTWVIFFFNLSWNFSFLYLAYHEVSANTYLLRDFSISVIHLMYFPYLIISFSFVLFFFNFCNPYLCASFWFSHVFSISFAPQFRTDFPILSYFPILFPALVPLKAEEIIHWLSNDQYNCRRLILEEKIVPPKQQYQKSTEYFEGINGNCIGAINIDFVDENMDDFCPAYWD